MVSQHQHEHERQLPTRRKRELQLALLSIWVAQLALLHGLKVELALGHLATGAAHALSKGLGLLGAGALSCCWGGWQGLKCGWCCCCRLGAATTWSHHRINCTMSDGTASTQSSTLRRGQQERTMASHDGSQGSVARSECCHCCCCCSPCFMHGTAHRSFDNTDIIAPVPSTLTASYATAADTATSLPYYSRRINSSRPEGLVGSISAF